MAYFNGGITQVGEIKPSSFVTNRAKNLKGKKQLIREMTGVAATYGGKPAPLVLENYYFNYSVPIPGTKGWTINVFTVESDSGMVYYFFDDGEPQGTPQPSVAECWSVYYNYKKEALQSLTESLGLESPYGIPWFVPGGSPVFCQ